MLLNHLLEFPQFSPRRCRLPSAAPFPPAQARTRGSFPLYSTPKVPFQIQTRNEAALLSARAVCRCRVGSLLRTHPFLCEVVPKERYSLRCRMAVDPSFFSVLLFIGRRSDPARHPPSPGKSFMIPPLVRESFALSAFFPQELDHRPVSTSPKSPSVRTFFSSSHLDRSYPFSASFLSVCRMRSEPTRLDALPPFFFWHFRLRSSTAHDAGCAL